MVIFRIIRNLIRLALNLLWLPISILTRNLFLFIVIASIIAFFVILNNDDSGSEVERVIPSQSVAGSPVAQPPTPPLTPKDAPPLNVDAVRVVQNGNSSFAQDLLKLMNDNERAYYSQMFYWTMNNAAGGKPTNWSNGNTHGSITPQAIFLNSKGHACRKFSEVLKVKDIKQNIKGIACQRGGGAWCKLGPNSTPACGLGQEPSLWGDVKRSLGF